jgi:hypothetical protein
MQFPLPARRAGRALAACDTGLKWLQAPALLLALLFCLRGEGKVTYWLALAGAAPALRLALVPEQRLRVRTRLAGLWASARTYAESGGPLPWQAALAFVALPAGALLLSSNRTLGWGDSWPVIPTACGLLSDGSWGLGAFVGEAPDAYRVPENDGLPYCALRTEDGVYSSYPAGMVQFALPVVALARLAGADAAGAKVQPRLEKWTAAWVAAAALGLFFLVALRLAGPLPALLTTLLLASGSVMFSTVGQALWQHGGVIFWSLAVLLVEFHTHGRPGWRGAAVQGGACGMMAACRLSSALFIVPFGVWVLLRQPRRAFLVAAVAALAYLPWAAMYLSVYGNPLGPSTGQLAGGNWEWRLDSLLGLLVSPSRGLLVYQPWVVLAGLALLWRPRGRADEAPAPDSPVGWRGFCLAAVGLQLVMVAGWRCWWGGHCWGSRLLAETVPLLALLCVRPVALLCTLRGGRPLLAGIGLLAFVLHAAGVYWEPCWEARVAVERHPEMLWSWTRPPFLILWQDRR